MLPCVILHNAMSLDGRITNFPADLELYYTLAARWNPDATLCGSETVLAAYRQDPSLKVPRNMNRGSPRRRTQMLIPVRCWLSPSAGEGTVLGCYP